MSRWTRLRLAVVGLVKLAWDFFSGKPWNQENR